ncbi:ash family protein [Pandoraea terrigena]|nr:ash family protein [Pandoraea terrigena]
MKNPLTLVNHRLYSWAVAETTVTEIGVSNNKGGQPPIAAFFSSVMPLRAPINGRALAGASSDAPVSFVAGTPTLSCARPPRLASDGGPLFQTKEAAMPRALARPEQTQSPIEIIRAALREAAIAPTVFDALDVTGEALRILAELAQAEVHHGR